MCCNPHQWNALNGNTRAAQAELERNMLELQEVRRRARLDALSRREIAYAAGLDLLEERGLLPVPAVLRQAKAVVERVADELVPV